MHAHDRLYAASSSSFCCNQRLTNSSTFTPRFAACFSISFNNSTLTGIVQVISKSASGAFVSNSVKSWLSQNSPIFSSESAPEMLLSLFSSISFTFLVTHVASADDGRRLESRLVNEKDRKVSATKSLSKRGVHVFSRSMSPLCETDAWSPEENLSCLTNRDMMF